MNIKEEIKRLETELLNTNKAIDTVKEQIKVYDLKGKELAMHYNYTKGAVDILKDLYNGLGNDLETEVTEDERKV